MSRSRSRRMVVFDLDGTLVDSLPLVLAAIRHAIEPFGGQATRDIFGFLGGPPERFLAALVPDPAKVPEALHRMHQYHVEHGHLIRPYDGAHRLLQELCERGVRTAVWTGRDRASTRTLLESHGLESSLTTVVCGDDLPTHKPDPAGLRAILRELGADAAETLLVGDADVDVLGGHACGVDTVLILHERRVEAGIVAKSWRTVATPHEAYGVVRQAVAAEA